MRDTRAELLSQAETLVRGRGFAGFSYADLAEAVGIRKASIHHHFPTKVDLGAAWWRPMPTATTPPGGDPRGRAGRPGADRAYGQLYLGGVEQGLGCLCAALAIEGEALPERLRHDIATFFEGILAWLEAVLRAGQADGSVRSGPEPAGARPLRHRHAGGGAADGAAVREPGGVFGDAGGVVDGSQAAEAVNAETVRPQPQAGQVPQPYSPRRGAPALAEIAGVAVLDDQLDQLAPPRSSARPQVCALSSHISGVCSTNRRSMPRFSATCSALIVSSRQSG